MLAENGHFLPFFTPPKTAHKNGSKIFDAFLLKPSYFDAFLPKPSWEKTNKNWRNASKKIKIERMRQKKLNFFSWAIFGGVKNGRNLLTKNWKLTYVYYIYNHSDKCRKNSCGFNFFIKLEKFSTIFKITLLGWFFEKMVSNLTVLEGIFEA